MLPVDVPLNELSITRRQRVRHGVLVVVRQPLLQAHQQRAVVLPADRLDLVDAAPLRVRDRPTRERALVDLVPRVELVRLDIDAVHVDGHVGAQLLRCARRCTCPSTGSPRPCPDTGCRAAKSDMIVMFGGAVETNDCRRAAAVRIRIRRVPDRDAVLPQRAQLALRDAVHDHVVLPARRQRARRSARRLARPTPVRGAATSCSCRRARRSPRTAAAAG